MTAVRSIWIALALVVAACGSDDVTQPDGSPDAASADAGCDAMLQYGDLRHPDDDCWAPPESYCSGGAGGEETTACSTDGSKCCRRPDTCVPCGWVICGDEPERCPDEGTIAELLEADNEECRVLERPFCASEFEGE